MMKLEECKVQRRAAVEEARRQVAQQELPWRREMAVKLGISRAQCAAADRARDNLRAERDAARKEIARLRGALAELTDANRRLLEQHDAEANWARQPLGPAISKMAVGPITEQDEEEILDGYNISGRKGGAASGRRVTSFRNTDPLRHTASTAASASAAAAAYAATGGGGGGDAGAGGDPSGS